MASFIKHSIFKYIFIISVFFCFSCKYLKQNDNEKIDILAKAYDYYLYQEDLSGVVPQGASLEDSTEIVKNYIENWIRLKAVLHKAEKNLDEEKKMYQISLKNIVIL